MARASSLNSRLIVSKILSLGFTRPPEENVRSEIRVKTHFHITNLNYQKILDVVVGKVINKEAQSHTIRFITWTGDLVDPHPKNHILK